METTITTFQTPKGTRRLDEHGEAVRQPGEQEVIDNPNGSYVLDMTAKERAELAAKFAKRRPGK